jgi:hypothetical protein
MSLLHAVSTSGDDKLYVDDVFSTYLYTGNGSTQTINNGIALADGAANGTVLHLTGDTLTDSAPIPNTITVFGNTSVSTTVKKYGTGSLYFDGSGDYLTFNVSSQLFSIEFTIEMWFYDTYPSLSETRIIQSSDGLGFGYRSTFGLYGIVQEGVAWEAQGGSVTKNTWNHLVFQRDSSNYYSIYVNGVRTVYTAVSQSNGTGLTITIGQGHTGLYPAQGYIDDLRITKGKALYTSNFTPPTQALPLDTFAAGKGGMVWLKSRSAAEGNRLTDTLRGATNTLVTNGASSSYVKADGLTSFSSNGFVLGAGSGSDGFNTSSATYASWTFRKAPKFFDVVTYTGNGVAGRQIAHSLGQEVGMIVVKSTNKAYNWAVWHKSSPSNWFNLNNTNAAMGGSPFATSHSTTAFSISENFNVNELNTTYVA